MSEVDIYDPDEYVKKAVEQFNAGQYAGPESESEDSDYADNDEKSFAETLQALTEKTKNSEQELDEAHTEPASDPEAPHAEQSTETTLPVESKPTKETEPADEEGEYIDFTQEELLERASELEKSGQHKLAIKYFLFALDTHKETLTTEQIAFCLERLSVICRYHKKDEEANRFASALRLIYETQLVQLDILSKPVAKSVDKHARIDPSVEPYLSPDVLDDLRRADQAERIARMFFEQKNTEMAEAYLAKAIHMRKQIANRFGVNKLSEITREAVEVDNVAKEGRDRYKDSLKEYYLKSPDNQSKSKKGEIDPDELEFRAPVVKGPLELLGLEQSKEVKRNDDKVSLHQTLNALDLIAQLEGKKAKQKDSDTKDAGGEIGRSNVDSKDSDDDSECVDDEEDYVDEEYLEELKKRILARQGAEQGSSRDQDADREAKEEAILKKRREYAQLEATSSKGVTGGHRNESQAQVEKPNRLSHILFGLSALMLLLAFVVWLFADVFFPLRRVYRPRR